MIGFVIGGQPPAQKLARPAFVMSKIHLDHGMFDGRC